MESVRFLERFKIFKNVIDYFNKEKIQSSFRIKYQIQITNWGHRATRALKIFCLSEIFKVTGLECEPKNAPLNHTVAPS